MTGSRSGQARPATTRQVTIQDVARAAGVSRQTVSNVLNDGGRVGEAAKARVLDAVAGLGYHPHHGARSLRSRRTRQIAYIMPAVQLLPGSYIMQQFLQSLAAASALRSYSMVIAVPERDARDEMRRLIASRSVDAFLLSDLEHDDPRVDLLTEAGVPFACFGRTGPSLPQHWVDIDNHEATAVAVEHVLSRGFNRITFFGYRSEKPWDTARAAGFTAGLARSAIPAGQADMLFVDETNAREKIMSLLGAARRPDAIVTSSDRLAAVVYGVAAELRLRIGHDLAVTGFDGSIAAELMHPRLTSVAIPIDDIAKRVVARALRQIDQGPDQAPGEVVPATLRPGASTGDERGTVRQRRAASLAASPPAVSALAAPALVTSPVAASAPAASALVRGMPGTVAIIVSHLTRPSTVVRVASALAVLEEQGYASIVFNVDTPLERDRHLEALLPTHRADGVLAICLPFTREQLDRFSRAGVAVVSVDAVNPGVPQTVINDVAGGRLATDHLIGLGHRRIGFVGDMPFGKAPADLGFVSSAHRLRGYRQALAAAGIEAEADLIKRGSHDTATAAEHAARLLKSPDPPSAIFAASDTQAIGVLSAADRLGVTVPGELSVIGFDDIESAAFLGLSSIRQPLELSGAEGARRLCSRLRGERVRPLRQELAVELMARRSSGIYLGS